ncbi:hypothetical protein WJX73_007551 [Symbiochloris irregularis]|uniref:Conserved oligomeric Golgi complex subunit 7 n=1 Tax=Symbiochloris irregularis TaxID=706552 RepID=A0AAW1PD99_9CHLO
MADLAAFATEGFNLAAWVDGACRDKPAEESMEKYLARLEMRLHLAAEDVEASIDSEGKRALSRIPIAVSEVAHVQGDVASLNGEIQRLLSQLAIASAAASESTSLLRDADLARSRMEEVCTTLKDAGELSELWASVGALFAEGDVQRIATALGTMRRSLALVAHLPEFQASSHRLTELEERFQSLVEPQLGSALSSNDGATAAQLAGLLISLGNTPVVERLYISARLPHMLGAWERYKPASSPPFLQWLPTWCDDVTRATEAESSWCVSHLPELHPQLSLQLLVATFRKLDASFRTRLASGLSQGGAPVEGLVRACGAVEGLIVALSNAIADGSAQDFLPVAGALYGPLSDQVERYGVLEAQQLDASFPQLPAPSSSNDTEAAVAVLQRATSAATEASAQLLHLLTHPHDDSLDMASVRLRAEQGRLSRSLLDFSETAGSPGFVLLPNSMRQNNSFTSSCHALVYDVLMHTVRTELDSYAQLPAWSAAAPNASLNLPSFSAYPQAQVTAAGEYLMMLPQHLEALLADDNNPIDAEWLDKVAMGAADVLLNQLQSIRVLKPQGSQQLAADLEYFCNVLSALGVAAPAALATWQAACGWSPLEFSSQAANVIADGADQATLQRIAAARELILA